MSHSWRVLSKRLRRERASICFRAESFCPASVPGSLGGQRKTWLHDGVTNDASELVGGPAAT